MARELLSLGAEVAIRTGFGKANRYVGSGAELPEQLTALIVESAKDMMSRHEWQVCQVRTQFTTKSTEEQMSIRRAYPDLKKIYGNTVYNTTQGRRVYQLSRDQWAALKSRPLGPTEVFYRISGGKFLIPAPTAGETVTFEYLSKNWLETKDGTARLEFPTKDSDICLLDDEALILCAKYKWKLAQGLPYGEEKNEYLASLEVAVADDEPKDTINMNQHSSVGGLGSPYISEGSWNFGE